MSFSAHVYTSIKSLHYTNKTLHSWAIQTQSPRLQSIHLSIKSIPGTRQPWPTTGKSLALPVVACDTLSGASLLTARPGSLPFPEQVSSHRLAFAQQFPGPGVPFLSQPGETFCFLYPSSTPSIPCSCPGDQLSPSPHSSLRK